MLEATIDCPPSGDSFMESTLQSAATGDLAGEGHSAKIGDR